MVIIKSLLRCNYTPLVMAVLTCRICGNRVELSVEQNITSTEMRIMAMNLTQ